MSYLKKLMMTLTGFSVFAFAPLASFAAELNIYSYRKPPLLKPFLDAYSAETGIKFNVVHAPKGLVQRLQAEGSASPADVILTVDVSRLYELSKADLLAPLPAHGQRFLHVRVLLRFLKIVLPMVPLNVLKI